MASKNGDIPTQSKKVDAVNSSKPSEANIIPVLPNNLTSKLGKDESANFLDDISKDGKDMTLGVIVMMLLKPAF